MSKFTIDPQTIETAKILLTNTLIWLSRAFDKTATWVSKLSWWKFFLFAILLLASADIIQNTFFSTEETKQVKKVKVNQKKAVATSTNNPSNEDPKFEIDNTGIRIKTPEKTTSNKRIDIDGSGWKTVDENQEKLSEKIESTVASLPNNNKENE
ncbi:hypothetical protein K2X05_10215, partial [bacterium]|nr:hypothetical protein [bacterium]